MIRSFKDRDTERLWRRQRVARVRSFALVALRKLRMLDAAEDLFDLRTPPGNRLEALSGDRQGQYNIRINARWRICFVWESGAHDVELADYL